jgi:hypothetical protein
MYLNSLVLRILLVLCSYEDAFNRFADEINCLAAYQWWEGSVHSILSVLAYPVAWSWQQWRRRKKIQRLREYVRSEYDHACLRSCRSRALYEGLKVEFVEIFEEVDHSVLCDGIAYWQLFCLPFMTSVTLNHW